MAQLTCEAIPTTSMLLLYRLQFNTRLASSACRIWPAISITISKARPKLLSIHTTLG